VTDIHERRTAQVSAAIAADHPQATVVGYPMDAGDRQAIDRVITAVTADLGGIDILVNNAAVNVIASHFDYDPQVWEWILQVNLTGPWYLCRRVLPLMRDSGRGGVVVNVSSYAPDVGGNGLESPYAISKGGLNVLTRSVAHEGGPFGIRAVTVSMGVVRGTKFIDDHPEILASPDARGALPWLPSAGDIAETIAFVASDRARCITGESINVSSGSYMRI
jgi:NAD(P)-dependent dehydrogenase (short-subunit alcohol dehydrogenase family)